MTTQPIHKNWAESWTERSRYEERRSDKYEEKRGDKDFSRMVLIDQTAFAAFMNPEDPYYPKARSVFFELDDLERRLATTNAIVFETHEWLRNRGNYGHAQLFLETVDQAVARGVLTILPAGSEPEREARQLIRECPEYRFSLNEALLAVLMLKYDIRRMFTFNPSFQALPRLEPTFKTIPSMF
ncbi:type II toxin-antitoxin system VapC family toxin [Paenibacillus ginsengihumi]|uniref:type II toxin-antitoxin system VapC family toxin n=1 Tax=Paenibacillus ginsengihumi TaxID=431596 RepID=UPI000382156B|nr:type II toxin-antitoxin system VapC family toxin [Paenibacillus ginsengihumi]